MTQSPAPRSAPRRRTSTPTGDPVLSARFAIPARPHPLVHRRRLAERLSTAVHGPLTLINGPAGSGKTVLAADWAAGGNGRRPAERVPGHLVWLTAEPEDNAPGMFWAYVLEALRQQHILGPDDIGHPARADEVSRSLLARLAAELADLPDPVILVLDDFDHICSPEVAAGLQFVLAHAAARLRLVLLGRTEPLLPLHRYRAAGDMAEIRLADLAFTSAEATELLRGHGLSVSPEGMRALITRTEGWAAGLRLCALAMRRTHDADAFLRNFEAGQSTIADFLLAEAVEVHPAATQDLLLRTSILERTHPDLADALTGRDDAAWILGSLRRTSAFVEPIGGSWYRHHPLFAEILRAHLRSRHPGLEPQLHRRAARWFDAHGQADDALAHAAAAGDWAFAADRFIDDLAIGKLFSGLDTDRLWHVFSGMAPGTPGSAPALVAAACRLVRYDAGGALACLRRAAADLQPTPAADHAAVLLSGAFLHAIAGRLLGTVQMAEAAARDIEELAARVPVDRLERHPELRALALIALGSVRLQAGRLDAAEEALMTAAKVAAQPGPGTEGPLQESLGGLAFINVLRGQLRRATARARESIAVADRAGLPASCRCGLAHLALAGVAIERDHLAAARSDLELAAAAPDAQHDPIAVAGLALLRSRLCLAEGRWRGALALAQQLTAAGRRPNPAPRWAAAQAALVASAAHLAHGDTTGAVHAAQAVQAAVPEAAWCALAAAHARLTADKGAADEVLASLPLPDPAAGPALAVRTLLVRAQAAASRGNVATARKAVDQALILARPELLRRPFLEAGPWLSVLLRGESGLRMAGDWLAVRGGGVECPTACAPPLEPLSAREREVLQRAAQCMSTEEIAHDLCLSVNTVKTHLKSIYRKLSTSRRGEAVRRARQFRLL